MALGIELEARKKELEENPASERAVDKQTAAFTAK